MPRPNAADGIKQRPQSQASLQDQLTDLHIVAARLGLYDAADWLWKSAVDPTRDGRNERGSDG